jgi:transposase-like protein
MKQKSGPDKAPAEQVLKNIRRQTRRQYSAEEKIRIVLEGLRGEENISELCRREGIAASHSLDHSTLQAVGTPSPRYIISAKLPYDQVRRVGKYISAEARDVARDCVSYAPAINNLNLNPWAQSHQLLPHHLWVSRGVR